MNCSDCYYGRKPGEQFDNSCYRYPMPGHAGPSHWCGEWSDVDLELARFVKHPKQMIYEGPDRTYYGAEAIEQAKNEKHSKPVLSLPRRK